MATERQNLPATTADSLKSAIGVSTPDYSFRHKETGSGIAPTRLSLVVAEQPFVGTFAIEL